MPFDAGSILFGRRLEIMKFTRAIQREVEIDGQAFMVKIDDSGVDFRPKGKRKGTHVSWATIVKGAEYGDEAAGQEQGPGAGAQGPGHDEEIASQDEFARPATAE
jgi:hypothetical protein